MENRCWRRRARTCRDPHWNDGNRRLSAFAVTVISISTEYDTSLPRGEARISRTGGGVRERGTWSIGVSKDDPKSHASSRAIRISG